jgi:hypothetical protein
MEGKITLITPPDIFENDTYSILFIHLNDADQELVSAWFAKSGIKDNVNIYFYSGETNVSWFFHALARCEYTFMDLNSTNSITASLAGYVLGKKNIFYQSDDENTVAIYSYINQNRITNIESFLERAFNGQTN